MSQLVIPDENGPVCGASLRADIVVYCQGLLHHEGPHSSVVRGPVRSDDEGRLIQDEEHLTWGP